MAQYEVTSAQLTNVKNELNSYNEQFIQRVSDLEAKQQELKSMWQGDANNTFDAAFNSDKDQWKKFATLMQQYIEALAQQHMTRRKQPMWRRRRTVPTKEWLQRGGKDA